MSSLRGRPQGHDSIEIEAAPEVIWPNVGDSSLLPRRSPPVRAVELIDMAASEERVASRRKVEAKFGRRNRLVP